MEEKRIVQYMNESGEWIDIDLIKPATDLERFVELYRSFGIECVVIKNETLNELPEYDDDPPLDGQFYIQFNPYESIEKFRCSNVTDNSLLLTGVSWAWTTVWFDKDGKFVGQVLQAK